MTERQLNESLSGGQIRDQYLLVGDEPLLIDRALKTIRDAIRVDESFDVDVFSLPDVSLEDIVAKLFLMPFHSARRLLIVRNLEDASARDLNDFAQTISTNNSGNCAVLIYRLDKDARSQRDTLKKLPVMFPRAECVVIMPEPGSVRKWIRAKIRRDNLTLDDSMVDYLEEEFSDDITGLKNEFEKIDNYLHEAGAIDKEGIRNLARGLCNCDKYQMVHSFLNGGCDVLRLFEELQPYLPTNAILVDTLTRGILNRARRKDGVIQSNRKALVDVVAQLILVDRKIKRGSFFGRHAMELFILQNAGTLNNGVSYGR
jgi:DNA polymerase III delta subunit